MISSSHECLQDPSASGVRAEPHAGADGVDETDATATALPGDAATDAVPPAEAPGGSVLVLEDDDALRDAIGDFLTESGYAVVTAPNGTEGIREVMAREFALVLCDIKMPGLAGDMFYRAVERVRPALCERFIFMSGHASNPKATGFLQSINAFVLRKPFHFQALADAIAYAEVRRTFRPVLEGAALPAAEHAAAHTLLTGRHSPELAPAGATAPPPTAAGTPARRRLAARLLAGAGIAGILALGAMLGARHVHAQQRATAAAAELRALHGEWAKVSAQLRQVDDARQRLAALPTQAKRLADERAAGGWVAALRAIATAAGDAIELRGLASRAVEGMPGACEIQIDGTATGDAARMRADEFYQSLRRELGHKYPGRLTAALDRLEDTPAAPGKPGTGGAIFAITVKIGPGTAPDTGGAARK